MSVNIDHPEFLLGASEFARRQVFQPRYPAGNHAVTRRPSAPGHSGQHHLPPLRQFLLIPNLRLGRDSPNRRWTKSSDVVAWADRDEGAVMTVD